MKNKWIFVSIGFSLVIGLAFGIILGLNQKHAYNKSNKEEDIDYQTNKEYTII